MLRVQLASPADFAGWRRSAKILVLQGMPPEEIEWTMPDGNPDLLDGPVEAAKLEETDAVLTVSRDFVDVAKDSALHHDPARFSLLYRLLWRLREERNLMRMASDADVVRAVNLAKSVRRDIHKMHAFVRFQAVPRADGERYLAWFEPEHHVVETATPFFMRRFANMLWTIFTPRRTADWDGAALTFSPGVEKPEITSDDGLEALWRRYYASIFNPARVNPKAMQAEMPKRFWRNLPEAALIQPLIREAAERTRDMIEKAPQAPVIRRGAAVIKEQRDVMPEGVTGSDLEALRREAAACRACPLWEPATQTVFGEGPADARIVFVGEQPGDQEDIQGRPFVGPAGQLLDRALAEAEIDRAKIYVTNAVKHFKFMPRGKRRIHQKPGTPEIRACGDWLGRELAAIQPTHVVALGATAIQSVFGRAMPVNANRGKWLDLDNAAGGGQRSALITVHPSYLLRLPDEDLKQREYRAFVEDLSLLRPFQ